MLTITIKDEGVLRLLESVPKQAGRATEIALDKTAVAIGDAVKKEMPRVFDRPTPYTLNSLLVTRTQKHNMRASVGFKVPPRMHETFLAPEILGGPRRLKGFEVALGRGVTYLPSKTVILDAYGNFPSGRIRQIMSVFRISEGWAGHQSNITERSKKRNLKPRDYVLLTSKHGKLPPGIYERYVTGRGISRKTKKNLPFGEWERGKLGVVRARGLRPVLVQARILSYRPRLPFYKIGQDVYDETFLSIFSAEFQRLAGDKT